MSDAALWVDPGRRSGQVCVAGTRIPAETIAGMVLAGDSVEHVAESYEVTVRQVLCCCWWVALHDRHRRRWRVWRTWAEAADLLLWDARGPLPDAPPTP